MENRRASTRLIHPTWALGFLAVFLLTVETLTGVGLMFHYRPAAETAWLEMVELREASAFGFVRDLHYWGSHLLLVVVWLHLLRTFASGLYKPPRQRNWTVGVALLATILLLAYTGSLLPWDDGAVQSIATRAPSVLGSAESRQLDGETLRRFFALHCGLLPAAVVALAVWHVRLARKSRSQSETAVEAAPSSAGESE